MHIDLNELIWAIINFLVLLALLYKFLWNPILNTLDKRSEEIKSNLSSAEALKKQAEEMLEEYKKKIADAKSEAQAIINQANKAAEENRNKIISQAHEEAARIIEKAREEIRREKEQALKEVRDEIATLAVMAAGKVLEKSITKEDHEKLVREFLAEVGEIQ
ncbi:MAG: ATP synthase subunit b [Clostridia bacterium 41_269]|nr:MAG: ATP synthase subunit b [Clostridia bacterium 41_269]